MSYGLQECHSPISFNLMYLPTSCGNVVNPEEIQKIDAVARFSVDKMQQFLSDNLWDYCLLEFQSAQLDQEPARKPNSVHIAMYIGTDEKIVAFANGFRIEMTLTQKVVDSLPEGPDEIGDDLEKKDVFELVVNHFLHEICHVFGAYHADQGIMSGCIKLFDENVHDFQLLHHLDNHSSKIVVEWLKKAKFTTPNAYFVHDNGTVTIQSNVDVLAIFFLKRNAYTKRFYYLTATEFTCKLPHKSEWDAIYVQFVYGATMYFKQSTIFSGGEFDRLRNR